MSTNGAVVRATVGGTTEVDEHGCAVARAVSAVQRMCLRTVGSTDVPPPIFERFSEFSKIRLKFFRFCIDSRTDRALLLEAAH